MKFFYMVVAAKALRTQFKLPEGRAKLKERKAA